MNTKEKILSALLVDDVEIKKIDIFADNFDIEIDDEDIEAGIKDFKNGESNDITSGIAYSLFGKVRDRAEDMFENFDADLFDWDYSPCSVFYANKEIKNWKDFEKILAE